MKVKFVRKGEKLSVPPVYAIQKVVQVSRQNICILYGMLDIIKCTSKVYLAILSYQEHWMVNVNQLLATDKLPLNLTKI